jgi:pyruvate dehydrogenase complex dehydrogenase (E1) component
MAIYQARFLVSACARHRQHRKKLESLGLLRRRRRRTRSNAGAIGPAARFPTTSSSLINRNLQRLDGPQCGNGKIIQELEGEFRGLAGT